MKHKFMWFLFQDVLSFTAMNIPEQPDYLLLQSMVKVFSLFKSQLQLDSYEVTGVWIWCNRCNKTVNCQFFETMLI